MAEHSLILRANTDFKDCPALDVLVIPGAPGSDDALKEPAILNFIRQQNKSVRIIATVCTGALIAAAAGVTTGKVATTHWLARQELQRYGVTTSTQRVVIDGKYWSAAGVSAGIDLAFSLVAHLFDENTAKRIQLQTEYDPHPPFDAGNPDLAPIEIVTALKAASRYKQ